MSQGKRVKESRKGLHISQKELAKILGVTQSNISMIENNSIKISNNLILRMAKTLEVDPGWLSFGSEKAAVYDGIIHEENAKYGTPGESLHNIMFEIRVRNNKIISVENITHKEIEKINDKIDTNTKALKALTKLVTLNQDP